MVQNCKYCKKEKTPTHYRSLFSFPKDPYLHEQWCSILGLDPSNITKNTRICSDHFDNKYITHTGHRFLLKEKAVPQCSYINNSVTELGNSFSKIESHDKIMDFNINQEMDVDINVKIEPPDEFDGSDLITDDSLNESTDCYLVPRKRNKDSIVRQHFYRNEFISEEYYNDFQTYSKYVKRRNAYFQHKFKHKDKRIQELEDENRQLKEKISKIESFNPENLPTLFQDMISRYKIKESHEVTTKTYSQELMEFSSAFYNKFRAAYIVLRSQLFNILPSTTTLDRGKRENHRIVYLGHEMSSDVENNSDEDEHD